MMVTSARPRLVVVGNGMVGHHFVLAAAERGVARSHRVRVLGEEPRLAYDRIRLSSYFEGTGEDELALGTADGYREQDVEVNPGAQVSQIDLEARALWTASGEQVAYDQLVLAMGSRPFVPDVAGKDSIGCFVYRTIEDLQQIRSYASGDGPEATPCRRGVVIGGGLLGLEAANALRLLGLETHVVEMAAWLMPMQLDQAGGTLLRERAEELGIRVHVARQLREILTREGSVCSVRFADATELAADIVVFSAGIRPRDELARACGLGLGSRGGIAVDSQCRTSDPNVFAIGECASYQGHLYGLVAPGYRMAEVVASVLAGTSASFTGFDPSAKLKLLGVDAGSFGDSLATTPGAKVVSLLDSIRRTYQRLVLSPDAKLLIGGVLVGDTSAYTTLTAYVENRIPLPAHPEELLVPPREGQARGLGIDRLPSCATICSCHNVSKETICDVIREQRLTAVGAIKTCTRAGTGCGSCTALLGDLLKSELRRAGVQVSDHLCEHFKHSRRQLFDLVRVQGIRTFDELRERHGAGEGCEVCKPAVASMLASTWNEHILEPEHAGLQDTNDRFLANIQRDGSYSVVPRIAAGEVTPDQLIALGATAKKYGLYTKITGGQRIDMFGARLEQLPLIWGELVAAGFESGHAYGKALRTVKSCVGSTWCRYGVQDSVALALRIEHRYKGLRSPHKLKGAVSGCARECAEAQGKDFGVIATDKGYNLYVCGNGGMKPQHAVLLATDLDADGVTELLDRFLMFYVRTADRLQRTASWFNQLEGGVEYLKQVLIHDCLGICAELESDMARVIASYACEWKATVSDPDKLRPFRAFVNSDAPDPGVIFVPEREQHRPARWEEKAGLLEAATGVGRPRTRLPMVASEAMS